MDKYYRLMRGFNWWPDEQPSDEIKEACWHMFGVNNKFYDAAMLVLKEAVNDKYDYISWWLYEGEPDYKVWSSDNTEEWNLTEPEALYDFIVNECQE